MAELTEASSSASKIESSSFDVFLSFRGKDTRNNFTSFLYKDLKNRGIDVFIDSEKLWTGEAIGPALRRAIEGSKISIPVLSRGYVDSKWCLWELAQIVQCHRSNGQLILPIFFCVDPSHVRSQTGSFEEAFQEHEKKFKPDILERWRNALEFVGKLKGDVLDETENQAEVVESIVKRVLGELISTTPLAECKYPIGLDSRTDDMISLLDISSNDVQFVGICGYIGIGKTTIAKAVYNRLLLIFKKHSFLSDIREQATQCMDLVSLQKRLLKDIFQIDYDISDYHRGKRLIEQKLCKDKIFIVLDDVDSQEQIDALAGDVNWFGQGSRIIITTRDEHILNVAKVARDKIYRPQMLDVKQSLQLLCRHAYSMDQPPKDHMQFSHDVAYYLGGLPINLEVLGSYLSDRRIKDALESIFQKLNEIPQEQVYRTLKTIYDDLEDDCLKATFPDPKWHFIEWESETVSFLWERSSYCLKSMMRNFIKRSLLKVEESAKHTLRMHDHQIRDTGKKIVREESLMKPGRHCKSLSYGDILEVLKGHEGTGMIEGMSLPYAFNREPFQMMHKLKFTDISSTSASVRGGLLQPFALRGSKGRQGLRTWTRTRDRLGLTLFRSRVRLGWIGLNKPKKPQKMVTWGAALNRRQPISIPPGLADPDPIHPGGRSYPWYFLPTTFYRKRRDHLDYWLSNIVQALNFRPENENKGFQKLRVIDLSTSGFQSKSPECSTFSSLQRLDLSRCASLRQIPNSLGRLASLEALDLGSCVSLKELSEWLPSLQITNCQEKLKCVAELPSCSETLSVTGCTELVEIGGHYATKSLEVLDVRGCNYWTRTPWKMLGQGRFLPDRSSGDSYYLTAAHDEFYNNSNDDTGLIILRPGSLQCFSVGWMYNAILSRLSIHVEDMLEKKNSRKSRDWWPRSIADGVHYTEDLGEIILCLIVEFPSHYFGYHLGAIDLDVSVSIRRKDKSTRCHHTLRIEVDAKVTHPYLICFHHFKGFDWFGIPLQGEDAIEILDIQSFSTQESAPILKYWEVLFENGKPNLHSSAMMVADYFSLAYVDSHSVPQMSCSDLSIHKAMSSRAGERACYDEDEDVKQVNRPSIVEEAELRAIERHNLDKDGVSPTRVEEAMLRTTVTPILEEDDDEAACLSATDETGLSRGTGSYIFDNMDEMFLKAIERIVVENEDEEGVLRAMESLRLDEDNVAACPSPVKETGLSY